MTLVTLLSAPLDVGQEYDHKIRFRGIDSFLEATENVGVLIDQQTDLLELSVEFPSDRRLEGARAIELREGQPRKSDDSTIARQANKLILTIEKPTHGSKYVLEWDW